MSLEKKRIPLECKLHYYNIEEIENPEEYMNSIYREMKYIERVISRAIENTSVENLGMKWEEDTRHKYLLKPYLRIIIEKPRNLIKLFISPSVFDPKKALLNSEGVGIKFKPVDFREDSVIIEIEEEIPEGEKIYYGFKEVRWEKIKSEDIIEKIKKAKDDITDQNDNRLRLIELKEHADHYEVFFDCTHYISDKNARIMIKGKPINVRVEAPSSIDELYFYRSRKPIQIISLSKKGKFFEIETRNEIKGKLIDSRGFLYKVKPLKEDKSDKGFWIILKDVDEDKEFMERSRIDIFFELIDGALEEEVWEKPNVRAGDTDSRIRVYKKDYEEGRLCLARPPKSEVIYPPRNDYQLRMQRKAIITLMKRPLPEHRGLLRLFEDKTKVVFHHFEPRYKENEIDWLILKDPNYEGTKTQREFVLKAMSTPDFMFLEGPPGSGKTTAISELIYQLLIRNKRVLLVASTHVAVDNVLEKLEEYLKDKGGPMKNGIVPLRIGREEVVSEVVRKYRIDNRKEKIRQMFERENWYRKLSEEEKEKVLDNFVCWTSNLVCGTTIGILQYPTFKRAYKEKRGIEPEFDYMIIDEASKTTLPEFLVPAVYAKRWIIIGDIRQLSPYTDILPLRVNLDSLIKDRYRKRALLVYLHVIFHRRSADRFHPPRYIYIDRGPVIGNLMDIVPKKLIDDMDRTNKKYKISITFVVHDSKKFPIDIPSKYSNNIRIRIVDEKNIRRPEIFAWLLDSHIIFSEISMFKKYRKYFPSSHILIGLDRNIPHYSHNYRHLHWFYYHKEKYKKEPYRLRIGKQILSDYISIQEELSEALSRDWAYELAWRYKRLEELRLVKEEAGSKGYYVSSFYALYPPKKDSQNIDGFVKIIGQVFMTPIISCFHDGMSPEWKEKKVKTVISHGMPEEAKKIRFLLLPYQHRMHREISRIPRLLFYDEKALKDGSDVKSSREWGYNRYNHRVVWIDVKYKDKDNINEKEAQIIIRELEKFIDWAKKQQKKYRVMILTFYERQRKHIRDILREKYPRNRRKQTRFIIDGFDVRVYTVDRAQGKEADFVFLSMVRNKRIGFLDSPNRLNVALTRAKYQLVIVGNHEFFKRQKHSYVLSRIAEEIEKNYTVIDGERLG